MIKAELRRLWKSGIILALLLLTAILLIAEAVVFANQFDYSRKGSGYGIREYRSETEVLELLDEARESLKEIEEKLSSGKLIEADKKYYSELAEELRVQINIYQYISETNLPYREYVDYLHIRQYREDNSFSAFTHFCADLSFFVPFIFALLAAIFMPWDFHKGTYKFLYSTSRKRLEILLPRFLTWLIVATLGAFLSSVFSALLAFLFGGAQGSVLFANLSTVFRANYIGVFFLETANILLRTLVAGVVVFGVGLMVRNIFVPLVVNAILCVGSYILYFTSIQLGVFTNTLLCGVTQIFIDFGATNIVLLYAILVQVGAMAVSSVLGVGIFLKRDLK